MDVRDAWDYVYFKARLLYGRERGLITEQQFEGMNRWLDATYPQFAEITVADGNS